MDLKCIGLHKIDGNALGPEQQLLEERLVGAAGRWDGWEIGTNGQE